MALGAYQFSLQNRSDAWKQSWGKWEKWRSLAQCPRGLRDSMDRVLLYKRITRSALFMIIFNMEYIKWSSWSNKMSQCAGCVYSMWCVCGGMILTFMTLWHAWVYVHVFVFMNVWAHTNPLTVVPVYSGGLLLLKGNYLESFDSCFWVFLLRNWWRLWRTTVAVNQLPVD